jgi:hypothetical protein
MSMEFSNASDLVFSDISSEEWREYEFVGGEIIRIVGPERLHVSDSGGHRLFDAEGVSHYVPAKWLRLRWKAKDGQPNFVK